MSFTTGSLLHQESVQLARIYLPIQNWDAVRDKVISDNTLQARTLNTLKRVSREIISRLKQLSLNEIQLIANGSHQEQRIILWISICKRYAFIADFAEEVLCDRYQTVQRKLLSNQFDSFLNRKVEWHPEIEAIQPSTRNKLRQVLFKMMRDTGILSDDHLIQPPLLSPKLIELYSPKGSDGFQYLPLEDTDLRR